MATSQENDFGDALWNDDFYSSPSVISGSSSSNHIQNLKKTVLPNSSSSQSISAYLQESPKQNSRQNDQKKPGVVASTKSGLLQASPSLIALERILNKEESPVPLPQTIIEEEEEPAPTSEALSNDSYASRPNNVRSAESSSSVTTFQTALSSDRGGRFEYPSEHNSESTTTLSPIPDHEIQTPNLTGPSSEKQDTFDTSDTATPSYEPISVSPSLSLKSTEAPASPHCAASKRIPESAEIGKLTNTISKPVKNIRVTMPKQTEPELTEKPLKKTSNENESVEKPKAKYSSMLDSFEHTKAQEASKVPSARSKEFPKNPSKAPSKAPSKEPPKGLPKESPKGASHEILREPPKGPLPKIPQAPPPALQKQDTSQPFNLGQEKSATTNKTKDAPGKASNPKRFSFRSMFKSKSKNHSLSQLTLVPEAAEPSKPVKLSHKSRSTPDFTAFKRSSNQQNSTASSKPKTKTADMRKSFFTRKKSETSISSMTKVMESPISESCDSFQGFPPSSTNQPNITSKPISKVETPEASPETIPTPKFTPASAALKSPALQQGSLASPSVFSMETPPSALLGQGETIREVDDSDFMPDQSQETSRVNAHFSSPEDSPQLYMNGAMKHFYGQSLDPKNPIDMGPPFSVPYNDTSIDAGSESKVIESPHMPSTKSASSRSLNAQLAGEALFPKLLDPQEVESIVSIERSRSMRSIKSNNKRSSFINYNGSDENIILGTDVGILRQPSMKNSGGILKNSSSSRELERDLLSFDNNDILETKPETSNLLDTSVLDEYDASPASGGEDRFTDFIEFSDYIDYENLDFADSPSPENQSIAFPRGPIAIGPESHGESPLLYEHITSSPLVVQSDNQASDGESVGRSPQLENPDVIVISSASSPDTEPSASPRPYVMDASDAIASPLDKTYDFAVERAQPRRSPNQGARPVSMSFKGFKGSSFKDQVLVQSGSHQSIHLEEPFENSPVGQGFGSSDDESDSEQDTDSHPVNTSEESSASTPRSNKRFSVNASSSSSRRQQHMRNVLDLQPPKASVPFHHNRIPSISDHSAASSPKSLTSFMSRIRKSPMASPKVVPPKPRVNFSSRIILYDTYHQDEYDRHPEIGTCNQLTPALAQQIKDELNELKANMEVHSDSICYTQFF